MATEWVPAWSDKNTELDPVVDGEGRIVSHGDLKTSGIELETDTRYVLMDASIWGPGIEVDAPEDVYSWYGPRVSADGQHLESCWLDPKGNASDLPSVLDVVSVYEG